MAFAESQVAFHQPLAHAERVSQLEADAAFLIQRFEDIGLYLVKSTGVPQGRTFPAIVGQLSPERQPRRNSKDLGCEAQQGQGVLLDELDDLGYLLIFEEVDLVQDNDDLFAPFANALHEGPLTLRKGAVCGRDKDHQIAARHKLLGQLLMATDDGICAGRIYDVDLLEEGGWIGGRQDAILLYLLI